MKKRLNSLFLLFVLTLSFALSACSSSSAQSSSSKGSKSSKNQTTIKVWAMGEEAKNLPDLAKEFEKENPNIHVQVKNIKWEKAHDLILNNANKKNGPDVLQVGTTWVDEFAKKGLLLNLSSHVQQQSNFSLNKYMKSAAQSAKYQGKQVAVPWYVDTRVLFYRKDLLKKAGYNQPPRTWSQTKQMALKLSNRGSKKYGISIDPADPIMPFILAWDEGWSYQYQNGKTNFNDPKFRKAMGLYYGFFKSKSAPVSLEKDPEKGFEKGTMPLMISGPWMADKLKKKASDLKGKWNIATLPKAKKNTSLAGGSDLAVMHGSKHVKASLKFISFLTDKKTQVKWYQKMGDLPALQSAWQDPALKNDSMANVFKKQFKSAKSVSAIPKYEDNSQFLLKNLDKAITMPTTSLSQALKKFKQNADELATQKKSKK